MNSSLSMYCNRCGNKLSRESLFCNSCGTKVQQIEESPVRATPPSLRPPRPARRRFVWGPKPISRPVDDYQEEVEYAPDSEKETKPETLEEEIIFQIHPTFYGAGFAYIVAIVLSTLVTAAMAYIHLPLGVALALSAFFFILPIKLHIQNKRILYTLTNRQVEIEEGIFSQHTRNIPIRHIQDVTIQESFKERLVGIGDVIIDSAAEAGKITMNNINNPRKYADLILDQLQYWR